MPKKNKDEREDIPEEILEEVIAEEINDIIGDDVGGDSCCSGNSREDELKAELALERDRYLRLAAEYDNYRKRSQKEREALFSDIKAETVIQILTIYDNLERALAQTCEDEAFYKGVEMTMCQLMESFTKLGITIISAHGEQFDPELHNAVMHIEDEDVGDNTIIEEFQKGFKLGDKVIRFSMVKVAN